MHLPVRRFFVGGRDVPVAECFRFFRERTQGARQFIDFAGKFENRPVLLGNVIVEKRDFDFEFLQTGFRGFGFGHDFLKFLAESDAERVAEATGKRALKAENRFSRPIVAELQPYAWSDFKRHRFSDRPFGFCARAGVFRKF